MFRRILVFVVVLSMFGSTAALAATSTKRTLFYIDTNDVSQTKGELNEQLETRKDENLVLDNNILSIFQRDNYVYFGTHTGVSRLDLTDKSFKHYFLDSGDNVAQVIASNGNPNATIWVGLIGGFAKIDGDEIKPIPGSSFENLRIYSSFADKEDTVWFATSKNLHRFNAKDEWRSFTYENNALPTTTFYTYFIDSMGGSWIGGDAIYGLDSTKRMSAANWDIYTPSDSAILQVTSIIEDNDGWLWFGTNRGIFKRKVSYGQWYHVSNELPDRQITALAKGSDGTVWIGTKKGLVSYKSGLYFNYTGDNGLVGDQVNSISVYNNDIWVGTNKGAALFKDDKWLAVTRDGVADIDFTLTQEQSVALSQLDKQLKRQQELEDRQKELKLRDQRKGTFDDLDTQETWAREYVFDLHDRGVFVKNESFYPLRNVTWEEFIKMVVVSSGYSISGEVSDVTSFLDVPIDHWAVPFINKAIKEGIISTGKEFGMGVPVTRAQAVQILLKAFNVRLLNVDASRFEDVSYSNARWVDTAAELDIVNGYEKQISAMEPAGNQFKIPGYIAPGYANDSVKQLQQLLQLLGFYRADRAITGAYDGVTTDAVADYQVSRGILPKYTNGKFTNGLGALGQSTRMALLKEPVSTGKAEGVTKTFDPNGLLTRAQMAKIIFNLIQYTQSGQQSDDSSDDSSDDTATSDTADDVMEDSQQ